MTMRPGPGFLQDPSAPLIEFPDTPPFMGDQELQFLSPSDGRKILSRRTKDKFKDRIHQMDYDLQRGKTAGILHEGVPVVPDMSEDQLEVVLQSWEYFIKMGQVEGPRLLAKFLGANNNKTPNKVSAKGHVQGVAWRRRWSRAGQKFVDDVMLLLTNLQNEATSNAIVCSYTGRLQELGGELVALKEYKDRFLAHLSDTMGSRWTPEVNDAWVKVAEGVVNVGVAYQNSLRS